MGCDNCQIFDTPIYYQTLMNVTRQEKKKSKIIIDTSYNKCHFVNLMGYPHMQIIVRNFDCFTTTAIVFQFNDICLKYTVVKEHKEIRYFK